MVGGPSSELILILTKFAYLKASPEINYPTYKIIQKREFLNFVLYLLYYTNHYKSNNLLYNMKGDYSKIWELADYSPGVMRSREFFRSGGRKRLDKLILKNKEINKVYDSLSEEAREEIKDRMEKINEQFANNVKFYREHFKS